MSVTGLQLKLNAVVLPLVLIAIVILAWADYRHEFASTMDAHGIHASDATPAGPIQADTAPEAVAARSLRTHVLFGAAVALGLSLALNAAVSIIILRPIRRIRERIDHMARGLWRGPNAAHLPQDELGALVESFEELGLQMEAIVTHLLQSERLAATALMSRRLDAALAPALDELRGAVAALHSGAGAEAQRVAGSVARATATILAALHEIDAPFATMPNGRPRRPIHRVQGAAV